MPIPLLFLNLMLFIHLFLFLWKKVINHQPYDQKADVFSFAIVLWELVTAKVFSQVAPSLKCYFWILQIPN